MAAKDDDERRGRGAGQDEVAPMALWKKALAVGALLLGGVGVAFGGMTASDDRASGRSGENSSAVASGGSVQPNTLGGGTLMRPMDAAEGEGEAEGSMWPPLLAKGGLSFFVAFCIGYALRTFMKATMLVIGVTALAIFGLQKLGILGEIDWGRAEEYWDGLTANIGKQFASLRAFVTGSLPSAASAGVGLIAGFRR